MAGWRRTVAINVAVFVFLVLLAEGSARVLIYFLRGTSTHGIRERTLYLRYRPYVMYGADFDVTMAAERLRDGAPEGTYRVLLVGGSTAQLFPPRVLEKAFSDRYPGRRFQVINGGYGRWESRQELVQVSIWGTPLEPDLIISLDGVNDLDARMDVDKPGTFVLDSAYRFYLNHPFLAPLNYLLSQSQAFNGILRVMKIYQVGPVQDYVDTVPVYIAAEHGINVIARGLGAARLMVLQPFMAFKSPLSPQEAKYTAYKYRETVMKQLLVLADQQLRQLADRDHVLYLNTNPIYDGILDTLFSDAFHFTDDKGYEVMAKAIVGAIDARSMEGRRRASTGTGS